MSNLFKVSIQSFGPGNTGDVKTIIMRILGPDSSNKANDLIENGGTVIKGLNEEAANHLVSQLREAGAEVEMFPLEDDQVEKQQLFRVVFVSFGEKKLHVIKEIRQITGLGLKESKELVENLGIIADGVSEKVALKTKAKLESVGASVNLESIGGPSKVDQFIVHGKIKLSNGEPAGGILVRAYDQDLRSRELLGEAATQKNGTYRIQYTTEDFKKAEKNRADLTVQVFNEVGIPLQAEFSKEGIIFKAESEEEVNVQILEGEPTVPSEYERLITFLNPLLDGTTLVSLTDEEIDFLINESEIEEFGEEFKGGSQSIAFLVQSAILSEENDIRAEVFYAWGREDIGVVDEDNEIYIRLEKLLESEDKELSNKLNSAVKGNIIPALMPDEMKRILERLKELRINRGLLVEHQLKGKVLDKINGRPIIGYEVSVFSAQSENTRIQTTQTDNRGGFTIDYITASKKPGTDQDLLLKVFGPDDIVLIQNEIKKGQIKALEITISLPEPEKPQLPGEENLLSVFNQEVDGAFTNELINKLETMEVKNLKAFRKLAAKEGLENLSNEFGEKTIAKLKAYADLSVINNDLNVSKKLIANGYTSPLHIASVPVHKFVTNTQKELGSTRAMQLANASHATVSYLDSAMMDIRLEFDRIKDIKEIPEIKEDILDIIPKPTCNCGCNHALSPNAYLADLLDYITTHLDLNGTEQLTLEFLHERFHQPFDQFPNSCSFMSAEVRQVRICVEVLQDYLNQNPPEDEDSLSKTIKEYVLKTYKLFLQQLGTSYEEVRLVDSDVELRKTLAERLGILPLRLRGNNLSLTDQSITEFSLQKMFGLKTTDDPLRIVEGNPSFLTWQYDKLSQGWLAQDHPEEGDREYPIIDPDLVYSNEIKSSNPALTLQRQRKSFVSNLRQEMESKTRDVDGLDEILQEALATSRTQVKEVHALFEGGHDVSDYLNERELSYAAFNMMIKAIKTLETGNDVSDNQWEIIHHIAIKTKKQSKYETWIQEEKDASITLSPDFFVYKRKDFTSRIAEQPALQWLLSREQRRLWENILKARLDQKGTLAQALKSTVGTVEEEMLPILRDALIGLSKAVGHGLKKKAEWVTKQLQIDARMSGCAKTTRVSQAIKTLQNLVFSIRTGQLDVSVANFKPLLDSFDNDWKWMGSYATWKAATAVYLFPENVLQPTLRKRMTPGFLSLMEEVQNAPFFSAEQARDAANKYQQYFEDILQLKVVGGSWIPEVSKSKMFMVSRASNSSRYYWASYDSNLNDWNYSQSFWNQIPDLEQFNLSDSKEPILGVVSHQRILNGGLRNRFVCIFARNYNREKQLFELLLIRYDLNKDRWKTINLPIPDHVNHYFDAVVVQQTEDSAQPTVVITTSVDNEIFVCRLDDRLESWSTELDWDKPVFSQREISIELNDTKILYDGGGSSKVDKLRVPIYLQTTKDRNNLVDSLTYFYPRVVAAFPKDYNDNKTDVLDLIIYDQSEGIILGEYVEKNRGGRISISREMLRDDENLYQRTNGEDFTGNADIPGGGSTLDLKTRIGDHGSVFWGSSGYNFFFKKENDKIYKKVIPDGPSKAISKDINYIINPINGIHKEIYCLYGIGRIDSQCLGKLEENNIERVSVLRPGPSEIADNFNISDRSAFEIRLAYVFSRVQRESKRIPLSNIEYLNEAYYFVPLYLAQQLKEQGNFKAALDWYRSIYDYARPDFIKQEVYPHKYLAHNSKDSDSLVRADDWFKDPLNPHNIASSRKNTYLKHTLYSLIECLIDYADEQFTYDTSESLARARTLYVTAFELLEHDVLIKDKTNCRNLVIDILDLIEDVADQESYFELLEPAVKALSENKLRHLAEATVSIYNETNLSETDKIKKVKQLVNERLKEQTVDTYKEVTGKNMNIRRKSFDLLSTNENFAKPLANLIDNIFIKDIVRDLPTREFVNDIFIGPAGYVPKTNFSFCIPANPVLDRLKLHVSLNLEKLRTCRNIAGLQREMGYFETSIGVDSLLPRIGASGKIILPTSSNQLPTLYRYIVLLKKAKEYVNLAQQIESAYLSALQNKEAELYSQLKSRQDLDLSKAGVRLQDLRVDQAAEGITLAELQKYRAEIQVGHYQNLISNGLSGLEKRAIESMVLSAGFSTAASVAYGAAASHDLVKSIFTLGLAGNSGEKLAASFSSLASAASTTASIISTYASYERREKEWRFAKQLAQQDTRIGRQQLRMAESSLEITNQERNIAVLQSEHAETTLDFLINKDLNADLYRWMSGVLRKIYAFFLQQATAIAITAERQLAFERQEGIAGYIQNNYWNSIDNGTPALVFEKNESTDRLGLTGSVRLLQDLYKLDQYAFETEQRKQQLSVSFSMARLDPFAFQLFRESGRLTFDTKQELFDRRFPGQYLRLIKQVRVSVVALVPPVEGISATLQSTGISRVVIGGNVFQSKVIRREPETISFTAPFNASGTFELNPNPDLLLPFEGNGVDTRWEFSMPESSNALDYTTVADVILTIEYTALYNTTYKKQVQQDLDPYIESDRAFSFRQEFADAWYDLNNPDLTETPMSVSFKTFRSDFPPNVNNVTIAQVLLYFTSEDKLPESITADLIFALENDQFGGEATIIDGIISTRKGNGTSWSGILGKRPEGTWKLSLPNNQQIKNLFKEEKIKDILFVVTFSGQNPKWL